MIPKSKYKCQRCFYTFELDSPRQLLCSNCGHNYIDWLNSTEVLAKLHNTEEYKSRGY